MSFIIAISRVILPIIAVVILTKCMLSLVLGHPKEKTYGYIIDMFDGESYPLNMWETSIGRSNSCDIVVGYDTVSRFQAVISRRIDGWYVYDLLSKSGVRINSEVIGKKATVKSGDVINLGGMDFRFMVADDPVVRVGKKKKSNKHKNFTPVNSRTENEYYENGQSYIDGKPYNNANPFADEQRINGERDERPSYENSKAYEKEESTSLFDDETYTYSVFGDDGYFYKQKGKTVTEMPLKENFAVPKGESVDGDLDSIYSDKPSLTVETPNRSTAEESFTYQGAKPAIFNRDTGEVFILCGNTVSIGRSRGNDIKLMSPSVSRHHADLVLYEDGWAIIDANSSAGTTLNGEKINEPQLLFEGDVIGLSDERLYFTRNPALYK